MEKKNGEQANGDNYFDLSTDEGRAAYKAMLSGAPIEKGMSLEAYLAAEAAVEAPVLPEPDPSAKPAKATPKSVKKEDEVRAEGWRPLTQHRVIEIDPFGKERPRFNSKASKGQSKAYMRTEYKNKKSQLLALFGNVLVTPPVEIRVVSIKKMPEGWSKAKKDRMFYRVCQTIPDFDNIQGAIMDALFSDDSRIIYGECVKLWGYVAELHITLTEIDGSQEWEWEPSLPFDRYG